MATLRSNLILSLQDRVSGPARGIRAAMHRMEATADRMQARHRSMVAPVIGGMTGILAITGAALGLQQAYDGTVNSAKRLQAQLTEIGIKGEMSETQLAALGRRITGLTRPTNQFKSELLAGVDTMMAAGLAGKIAENSIGIIGKTSTATGASVQDLSATTAALVQNLEVTPSGLKTALEAMTQAGNDGAFEVRDMAREFPAITASAKALGMHGPRAVAEISAWLQIARRGAGDASTAANNFSNTLQKMVSKETIRNFAKFGKDVTKELEKAKKKGLSPIEGFIKLVDEVTKGGRSDLMAQLFGDKQVLEFLRPALADYQDFVKLRERAEHAGGIIDEQFERRMQNAEERMKKLRIAMQNLGAGLGARLIDPIAAVANKIADTLNSIPDRVNFLDKISVRIKGFVKGLGIGDGTIGGLYDAFDELILGRRADFTKAVDEMGRSFVKFRRMGEDVRAFGENLRYFAQSVRETVGDGALAKSLGQIGSWGLTFALSAFAFSLFGRAIMKVGKALLFLTGIKPAWRVLRFLARLAGLGKRAGDISKLAKATEEVGKAAGKTVGIPGGKPGTSGPWGTVKSDLADGVKTGSTGPRGLGPQLAKPTGGITFGQILRGSLLKGLIPALMEWAGERAIAFGFEKTTGKEFVEPPGLIQSLRNTVKSWGDLFDGKTSAGEAAGGRGHALDSFLDSDPLTGKPRADAAGVREFALAGTPTVVTRPEGVQQVQVTNPPPRPNINVTVSMTVNEASNVDKIARSLGDRLKQELSGLQADEEWAVS